MNDITLNISIDRLAGLAVEHWRLAAALTPALAIAGGVPARHALRKIEDFLRACEVETRALDGQPYDEGLAARVIDSIEDPRLARGAATIVETLSPMVLYRDNVVRPAEIVIARGPR